MSSPNSNRIARALARAGMHARVVLAIAIAGVVTTACDADKVAGPGALASITVTPNTTMSASTTQQMTAVGYDAAGHVVVIAPTWTVAASGGTISAGGMFSAGTVTGLFSNTVVATVGAISGSASITVSGGALAALTIVATAESAPVNGSQQFAVVGTDATGNIVPVTAAWSVVAGGGTIDQNGLFSAGAIAGTYPNTVQASRDGIKCFWTVTVTSGALATITVVSNPTSVVINGVAQFTAEGRDAAGNVVAIVPTWAVVANGGTINGTGLFTAGGTTGTFTNTVRASSGGVSGTATVNVTSGVLATIVVTRNPASVALNGTEQFTAVGLDAAGSPVAIAPTWSVVANGGTINSAGLFTAGTITGTFTNTVRATSGAVSGFATVIVTGGVLATITLTPNPASMATNGVQQFTAVGRDIAGSPVAIVPTWTVVASGGSINGTGLFTAGAVAGTFANTVRATSGSVSGFATVTVTGGALATITVTPNPASMAINGVQQFLAVGRDAGGNTVAMVPTWSVVASGGTVNSSGVFTAGAVAGTFTNTVRASSGNVSGTATVKVTSGVLATISVTPNPASMAVNRAQQFTAVGRDVSGNPVAIVPTWTVVAAGGTINSTGLFTAGGVAGTFNGTVRATSGAVSGVATVTVSSGVLATITVTPSPVSMVAGAGQQFVAVGKDASGNVVAIAPVWTVASGGGVISVAGNFTAGAVAGTFTNTVHATNGAIAGLATVTVTAVVPPPTVTLGGAALNGIMAGTAVTCITGGTINANVSISPGNTITGFGPCVITGVQHLNDAVAIQGQLDLTTAYNTLAGLPCPPANAIVANLGGTTKAAGVYCTGSGIGVTGTLTLDGGGDPNATFVFQAGSSLTTAGSIVLINGAQAKNVYWQVGSSATIGTASHWQGNILALTSITLVDNATLLGRALARNGAVTLGTNNVITLP
jgi:hypothetical protein